MKENPATTFEDDIAPGNYNIDGDMINKDSGKSLNTNLNPLDNNNDFITK